MLVVSVSVILLVAPTGAGGAWVRQLRVLRAFRLLRLLGKLGDLKKIVSAVAMSIAPTLQALVRRGPPPVPPDEGAPGSPRVDTQSRHEHAAGAAPARTVWPAGLRRRQAFIS